MKKSITIEDLCELKSASEISYSPDGKCLAFYVTSSDRENNIYKKDLWLKSSRDLLPRQITWSGKEAAYLWQDETTLLLLSGRGDEGKKKETPTSYFYRLDINGGEASPAFIIEKDVMWFVQVKPGLYCMAVKEDRNALPVRDDNETERKDEKDYHVIDEVPFWGNGRGFISGIRTCLYLYRESDKSLTKITPDEMDVASADVSGNKVLITGKCWKDLIDQTDTLLLYDTEKAGTENCCELIKQGRLAISNAVFCGKDIIVTATDHVPYGNEQYHDFYCCDVKTGEMTLVCKSQRYLGLNIMADSCYGSGTSLKCADGVVTVIGQKAYRDSLFCLQKKVIDCNTGAETEDNKKALEVSYSLTEVLEWNGLISCFDKKQGKTAFVAMKANGCAEVYEEENGKISCLTQLNSKFLETHFVSKAKHIPFINEAGTAIDGWVLEPKDYDSAKSYPAILEIHGGPRCTYGEVFFHEMQVWASQGWFVFFCNPRGSEGYGEAFADLRGKYGTIDYEDLMAFTDHVLELYPQIDRKRLGAAGGSYGGFMCNWIEGHTDRFAAIASQRSVSNWVSDFGCSEIGTTFDYNEMGATPWSRKTDETPEEKNKGKVSWNEKISGMLKMWECSPLAFADQAKTPILFIHSMCDYNCTMDQGIQMFTAMKYFGVPSRMCLFEGENHSLSRSGKPRHRIRRLQEMMDWFIKYLL